MSAVLTLTDPENLSQRDQFSVQRLMNAGRLAVYLPGHKHETYKDQSYIYFLAFYPKSTQPHQVARVMKEDPHHWHKQISSNLQRRGLVGIEKDDKNVIWWSPKEEVEELPELLPLSSLALGSNADPAQAKAQGPKFPQILTRYRNIGDTPMRDLTNKEPEQLTHPFTTRGPGRPKDQAGLEIPLTPENQFTAFTAPRTYERPSIPAGQEVPEILRSQILKSSKS